MNTAPAWLAIHRGEAPLLLAFPHGGTEIPSAIESKLTSPWLARKDADWWIAELYAFARELGATTVATGISRSVIDVNRDPSGASLYPGMTTTGLCPTETFDGEPLYVGKVPNETEIAARRAQWFAPYHAALEAELARLRGQHGRVVLYDAHSIRSRVPRLFDGLLPQFNIGTYGTSSCDAALERAVADCCAASGASYVVNGRFKGGWTTRHYGQPGRGIHAIQMELGMRGYLAEPDVVDDTNWPAPISPKPAIAPTLRAILNACLAFAEGPL